MYPIGFRCGGTPESFQPDAKWRAAEALKGLVYSPLNYTSTQQRLSMLSPLSSVCSVSNLVSFPRRTWRAGRLCKVRVLTAPASVFACSESNHLIVLLKKHFHWSWFSRRTNDSRQANFILLSTNQSSNARWFFFASDVSTAHRNWITMQSNQQPDSWQNWIWPYGRQQSYKESVIKK